MLVDRLRDVPSAARRIVHAKSHSEVVALTSHDYDELSIRLVDLRNCANKSDVLKAFGSGLRFPTYFTYNWDSFEECLDDLDKPGCRSLLLVLWFSNLCPPNEDDACILFAIIRDVAAKWSEGGQRRLSVILVGDVPAAIEKCLERNRLSVEEFIRS